MNIDIEKELSIRNNLGEPHLSYIEDSISNRKNVSSLVVSKNTNEILLIDSYGFLIDSVFAGLTEKHIEYIAKNAPQDYKNNILKILKDQQMMNGVFEITQSMDANNTMEHQKRIKNVIQYIKDNHVVFEF